MIASLLFESVHADVERWSVGWAKWFEKLHA
jgi:hypothetical protein